MRLTVVGSSDAFNALGRLHSCYLLEESGAGAVMVDFGATALAGLRRLGREPEELDAVAITHLHGDHFGGLAFLLIDAMFNPGRSRPLDLVGPSGVGERVETLLRVCYGPLAERARPFVLRVHELRPGASAEIAGWRIAGLAADHMDPPDEPLCLRLEARGRAVAFSGDTAMCEALLATAAGASLLVAECTSLDRPAGRHCSWLDWTRAMPRLGCPRLLLSHLGREVRERAEELRRGAPPGLELEFADDGLVLEI
jgi:ribonuclease BN (tRNA processing enzyme)